MMEKRAEDMVHEALEGGGGVTQTKVLSLKFRPHRATRNPHRQHRKTVIHDTRLIPQHSKRGENYTKWPKNYKAHCTH
jgi:hypothetical protein